MVYLRGQGREVRCVRQHTFGVQAGWLIRPLSALLHWQRVQRACRGWSVPHPPLLIRKMMGFVSYRIIVLTSCGTRPKAVVD